VCLGVVLCGVVALEMSDGLKEGTSGDQLRDFVEVAPATRQMSGGTRHPTHC